MIQHFILVLSFSFISLSSVANVCQRSESMKIVLEAQLGKDCKKITAKDLSEITELHFYESILSETSSYFVRLKSSDFLGLEKLKFLDLNWIFLEEFPEDLFSEIPHLEKLHWGFGNLENYNFKTDSPFRVLKGLKYLTLTNFKLDKIGPEVFSGLENLEILSLNHTDDLPTKLHPDSFKELRKLRILRMLRPIEFGKRHRSMFMNNKNLEVIGLQFSGQSDFIPGGIFKGLNKLKILYVESAGYARLSKYFFYGLESLELFFSREAAFLQNVWPYHFSKNNNLKINFSQISYRYGASREAEREALQKRFPGLYICREIESKSCRLEDLVPDVND